MTVTKKDVDDLIIVRDDITLTIKYPEVTYSYWKNLIPYDNDEKLIDVLDSLLDHLDCSVTINNKRLLYTFNMMYEYTISLYYYYLLHIENQFLYNMWLEILIHVHSVNIDFERNNPIIIEPIKKINKTNTKRSSSNFVKQVTTDLITNEETYIYSNSKTGEIINSSDPNLLDGLNGVKPKKEKKVKSVGVPMTSMTFNFKKK